MFRESSAIDSERTAASVRSLYAKYSSAEDNWFNGIPDSVDHRIAQCQKISNLCRAASVRLSGRNASSQYIALAHEMDGDRTALEGLRRDLLTAATDRDDYEDYPPAPDDGADEGLRRDREIDDLTAGGMPLPSEHPKGWSTSSPRRQQELERKEHRKENPYKYKDVRFMASRSEAGYFGDGQDNDWRDEGYYDDEDKAPKAKAKHRAEAPYKGKHRAEARHFIAEQECNDLRELTIRAQRHAERLSSTATPKASAAFVSSFVRAVRDEYQPPRQQRTASYAAPQDFPAEFIFLD